jgi:hypothetical protein
LAGRLDPRQDGPGRAMSRWISRVVQVKSVAAEPHGEVVEPEDPVPLSSENDIDADEDCHTFQGALGRGGDKRIDRIARRVN